MYIAVFKNNDKDYLRLISPVKTRSEYLSEVRKMLGAYPEF
jgi:hypothetical protein